MSQTELARVFESAYYPPRGRPWPPLRWQGVPCQKLATDLWALGELVWALRPGLIIETGTAAGGTALFLAGLLDALGQGQVLTMDVQPCVVRHPRISFQHGASTVGRIVAMAGEAAGIAQAAGRHVLVILDSDHSAPHVAAELAAYAPLVTVGSYCIVEDTNLGRSVLPEHGPGPADAVDAWLAAHPGAWVQDGARQPTITTNPGGLLRRVG